VEAIDAAVAGRKFLSAGVRAAFDQLGTFPQPRGGILSAREWEVLRLYIQGMSIGEIALRLERSGKTISTQKRSAMRKLGIESDTGLIKYAQQIGLT
jgi:two-component system capsular synthesis response regulator RcsB